MIYNNRHRGILKTAVCHPPTPVKEVVAVLLAAALPLRVNIYQIITKRLHHEEFYKLCIKVTELQDERRPLPESYMVHLGAGLLQPPMPIHKVNMQVLFESLWFYLLFVVRESVNFPL